MQSKRAPYRGLIGRIAWLGPEPSLATSATFTRGQYPTYDHSLAEMPPESNQSEPDPHSPASDVASTQPVQWSARGASLALVQGSAGIAAIILGLLYALGAMLTMADLHGEGLSVRDTIRLIPLPELLARGIGTALTVGVVSSALRPSPHCGRSPRDRMGDGSSITPPLHCS
jgi:hypothetical protein